MKSLYEQLDSLDVQLVGLLVGIDAVGPTFRNNLRDIPAIVGGYTLCQVSKAYLEHMLAKQ